MRINAGVSWHGACENNLINCVENEGQPDHPENNPMNFQSQVPSQPRKHPFCGYPSNTSMSLIRASLASAFLMALTCLANAADPVIVWPLPTPPPGTARASFAAPRADWFVRFQINLDKLKKGPYDLVFDGDSSIEFWQFPGRGLDIWKASYGAIKAADFGISGDQVQNVLWRLQHGQFEGQSPKLVVLLVGSSNWGQKPEEIADGIKLLVNEYETRCPAAHILLLGLLPRGKDATDPRTKLARDWSDKINAIISTYDDGKRVTYLDVGSKLLAPDGTFTADIAPDGSNLSSKGYQILADTIQPVIEKYFPPAPPVPAVAPASAPAPAAAAN